MKEVTPVEHLPDAAVDSALDEGLRALFTACFEEAGRESVFTRRRYFRTPYEQRWLIRSEGGKPVAHVGAHDRHVEVGSRIYRIGGICEVCVLPECRRIGYVRLLLEAAHEWLVGAGFDFAMLFGDPRVYASSGYKAVENLTGDDNRGGRRLLTGVMVRPLTSIAWPEGEVYLPGATF